MDGIANITPNIAICIRRCLPPTRAPASTNALPSNSTCWKSLPSAQQMLLTQRPNRPVGGSGADDTPKQIRMSTRPDVAARRSVSQTSAQCFEFHESLALAGIDE